MSEIPETKLHKRWRDRWGRFLTQLEDAETPDDAQNVLRDKVIIGNAERKIAGGHEGREILELLQNARDAIWNSDSERGRVHIGVYDEGVLVANTGSRFDLYDPQVEDAVTMIGETGKGNEADEQSIGHKGVGLKSILATGDAFEIYTRPDADSDGILGVRLSRSYLVSALLSRLGHRMSGPGTRDDLADEQLQQLLEKEINNCQVEITSDLSESISKLPLFNFPVPLETNLAARDPVRERVRTLLTTQPSRSDGEPYRTAVFIRYEDSAWRSRLREFGVPLPDEDDGDIEDRPERIWKYLAAEQGPGGLQPETVVQLGGIEQLTLERAPAANERSRTKERWEIKRIPGTETTVDELAHDTVEVHIQTQNNSSGVYSFDQFRFENPREYHTAILVNKAQDGESVPVNSYPLYLFYPIEGTDAIQLPFCLHGRFRVETNRKSLSSNNASTNQQVLREGLDLIQLIAKEVAAGATADESGTYSAQLPWTLLPPVSDASAIRDPEADELLTWFRQQLYERLNNTPCIPTPDGPHRPPDTLLHWERPVIEGYLAYSTILETLERDRTSGPPPLPSRNVLTALLTLPQDWANRSRAMLQTQDSQAVSKEILSGWVEHLAASLSMDSGGSPAVIVPAEAARSLLEGTVSLLTTATRNDSALAETLGEFADQFHGVYLLPCRIREIDSAEQLALVTLERRRTPQGGQQSQQRIRSVIWDIESASREIERPPTPPQDSNMTVYFLDEDVQEISGVHHVLSTAGRLWGLRAYEGMPSFVRSLLDTYADGRHDTVEPTDFAFLAAIVDRLGAESSDLQTTEGAYFSIGYLRTAVTQQEGDQRGNLRRRVQLRECDLQLHDAEPHSIANTILDDDWQSVRNVDDSAEDEDDSRAWRSIEPDQYPAPTWPAPDASTWTRFQHQVKRDVTDVEFARTLGLLGVGTLPGVRILWLYGDEHPSMRQSQPWNPSNWTADDFAVTMPETVRDLQSVLSDYPEYLEVITGPDFHPQLSADHSRKCTVKTEGVLEQVNLASWIWTDAIGALRDHGLAVRELLRRHGDALTSTLLRTGWSCNHGHKRRAWTDSVPSLLNWQLRALDIWDPVIEVNEELAPAWGNQANRLRYAVRLESRRGAQAARMFPYVETENTGFSDEVLATLGVHPVDELPLTGAADRLQQLQSVLVDGELPDTGTKQLWIPGERINDWNQAYTQLLQPILKQLPEDDGIDGATINWGALDHLPLREGDKWVTAPIDWIIEHADDIRYYQDQSPKPWETQEVADEGYYILPRTGAGPFTRLSTVLGVPQLDASKLVFDLEEHDIDIVTGDYEAEVQACQQLLADRRDILVASTERSDEEEILTTARDISTATSNIAVARSFPDEALRQLSDPTSALYALDDGQEALLLNAGAIEGRLSADATAMGLALLVERPTKVATFREALREDIETAELESRWAKRTFPIETVKRILGSNALQSIERDLVALNDLFRALDMQTVSPDQLLAALEDASTETLTEVRSWLANGEIPTERESIADEDIESEPVQSTIEEIWTTLPDELSFVATGLFGDSLTHWVRQLEQHSLDAPMEETVIEWLDDHRTTLERPPFDTSAKQAYGRFQTVRELWEQTDPAELSDQEMWVDRLRELHSNTTPAWTATLPESHVSILDCPPFLVHVCINDRVWELVDHFYADIGTELSAVEFDWRDLLTSYIEEGTIPEVGTETGAKDHQQRAFNDIASVIESDNGESTPNFRGIQVSRNGDSDTVESSLSAVSSGSHGGGSTQFRGRGQQAEAFVMTGVLDRVAEWIEECPGSDCFLFRSRAKRLHSAQQSASYKWHVDTVWASELLPLLEDPEGLDRRSLTEWRSAVAAGTPFWELPLTRFINVTMERGPGFDVIDPRGPLSTTDGQDDYGLWFTPIEVKAVDGVTPPFSFRLTTNEYRRAKAFVRDGDIPYVIRLVAVPEPGTPNWPAKTSAVAEKVIETESELENILDAQQFEHFVKGGYMNMRIE